MLTHRRFAYGTSFPPRTGPSIWLSEESFLASLLAQRRWPGDMFFNCSDFRVYADQKSRRCPFLFPAVSRDTGSSEDALILDAFIILFPRPKVEVSGAFFIFGSVGRGGGDRTRPPISKSRDLMALQPPAKSNC